MNHYVHNLDPIAFSLFGLPFPWYWLVYFFGYFFILNIFKKKSNLPYKLRIDYVFFGFFAMVFGGKIFYILFYNFNYYLNDPSRLLRVYEGGMSFHGALIGAFLFTKWFSKKNKVSAWSLCDLVVTYIPVVLFFGRLANFINGELAGRVSNVPWAVIFPRYSDHLARHPSQIYEAIGEGIILFIIMNFKKQHLTVEALQSAKFLFFYGIIRFVVEFFREADLQMGYFSFLTVGQIYCLIMIILAAYIYKRRVKIG